MHMVINLIIAAVAMSALIWLMRREPKKDDEEK